MLSQHQIPISTNSTGIGFEVPINKKVLKKSGYRTPGGRHPSVRAVKLTFLSQKEPFVVYQTKECVLAEPIRRKAQRLMSQG